MIYLIRFFHISIISLLLATCASNNKKVDHFKQPWEKSKHAYCSAIRHTQFMKCSYKPEKGQTLLFPEAKIGKEYLGYRSANSHSSVLPKYEYLYILGKYLMVKAYGDKVFTKIDLATNKQSQTEVAHIIGRNLIHHDRQWHYNLKLPRYTKISAEEFYSLDRKTILVYSSEGQLLTKITNIDASPDGKWIPSVNYGRVVRHNVNGRKFWQAYNRLGQKIGPEVDAKKTKVLWHNLQTSRGNQAFKTRYRRFLYEDLGNYIHKPYFSNGYNNLDFDHAGIKFKGVTLEAYPKNIYGVDSFVFTGENGDFYAPANKKTYQLYVHHNGFKDAMIASFKDTTKHYKKVEYPKLNFARNGVVEKATYRVQTMLDGSYIIERYHAAQTPVKLKNKAELDNYIAKIGSAAKLAEQRQAIEKENARKKQRAIDLARAKRIGDARRAREAAVNKRARENNNRIKNRKGFSSVFEKVGDGMSNKIDEKTMINNAKCRNQANRQNRHAGGIKYECKKKAGQ